MRFIREITSKEENFRVEPLTTTPEVIAKVIRRDFVEPEPVGTIVLFPFRITGYGRDCQLSTTKVVGLYLALVWLAPPRLATQSDTIGSLTGAL